MNIMKRPETGSPNYYVRFEHLGKKYLRSTGTPVMAAAKVKAGRLIASVKGDGKEAERMKLRNDHATLEDILKRFEDKAEATLEIGKRTVQGYCSALRSILKEVMGKEVNLGQVKATALTSVLLEEFKTRRRQKATGFVAVERAKRTANSTITQARSMFTKDALPIYEGLRLPDLKEFKEVSKFGLQQDTAYRPIPAVVIAEMEREARESLRETSPAQYLGYLMAIRLGMRDCEIVASRWEWLEEWPTGTQMAILVREDFAPKGAEGRVPVSEEVLAELRALGGPRERGKGFILPGATPTARNEAIYRELSTWVRGFLPDRVKSVHELRKHAGSIVVTQTKSLVHAQRFLRHRSVATTERHYATLLDTLAPLTSAHWGAAQKEVA